MMPKKKSKDKRKKLAKQRDGGSERGLGSSLRQAGTVAVSAIAAEIVAATVERLLQKVSQSKSRVIDSNGVAQPLEHSKNAIEGTTSKLKDGVQAVKPSVKGAADVVKDSFDEIRPTLTEVVNSLKEAVQETLQRSLAIASPAEMTVENLVDTTKSVIGAIGQTDVKKSDKKSKKKKKA